MQLISPINAATCTPYIGRQVCAVLVDGTPVVGTLAGVTPDGLQFNAAYPGATVLSTQPGKAKKQLKALNEKAKTKFFGFPGFGFGAFFLPWALLSLLFLTPFFFI
ncbi:hypothetical protein [Paenibacillus thermotolerans]|uniref:hypothetical protein n=1 Tax=Paenibacillus thermotolerans TaxID=3027807 RepID=UPI00236794AE|nr:MULTISPECIES: hypothetical protein [unclassified Paenibacillus]